MALWRHTFGRRDYSRQITCEFRKVWYTHGTMFRDETAIKVPKTPTLAEWQLCLTQTVTQSASAPYGQVGHGSSENLCIWTQSHQMCWVELEIRHKAISGPRGLGFESRYSDQKMKTARLGSLHFSFGLCRDSKDRPELSEGNKQSSGLFIRSWENPLVHRRAPCGCGYGLILSVI